MTNEQTDTIPTLQPAGDPSIEENTAPESAVETDAPPADDPAPQVNDVAVKVEENFETGNQVVTLQPLTDVQLTPEQRAMQERAQQLLDEGNSPEDIVRALHEEFMQPKPQTSSFTVETHEQAAEINHHRTAEQGYVSVGDVVTL